MHDRFLAVPRMRIDSSTSSAKAGVSVGSLYQYFPNKAAILFRLQSDEWRQTHAMLTDILGDAAKPPLTRLRTLVHAFVRSECEEAAVRGALNDAAPLYRDAPETREARAAGGRLFKRFMEEALPAVSASARALAGNLITTTMSAVGKEFSETPRTDMEIQAYADGLADMFCTYLRAQDNSSPEDSRPAQAS
jgi:AcrR family transcriptional regulator